MKVFYLLFALLFPLISYAEMTADLVVVHKSRYSLSLLNKGKVLKTYWISLGASPKGHKTKEGDQRTPEGLYVLDYKKSNSNYYKAIHINYPNERDLAAAQASGVRPGGMIMIHGQRNGNGGSVLQPSNWTNGCIAMLNADMDEVWKAIEPGTPIMIYP